MRGAVNEKQNTAWQAQQERNAKLVGDSRYMRDEVTSSVLPFHLDAVSYTHLTLPTNREV